MINTASLTPSKPNELTVQMLIGFLNVGKDYTSKVLFLDPCLYTAAPTVQLLESNPLPMYEFCSSLSVDMSFIQQPEKIKQLHTYLNQNSHHKQGYKSS